MQNKLFKQLADKYNLHYDVIARICNSPFIFAHKVMGDENDDKDIMFAYLFKIRKKNRFKKKNNGD